MSDLRIYDDVRPEVQWFAKQMEKKLQDNDHKAHWKDVTIPYLINRMCQEVDELIDAIDNNESPEDIVKECADVSNFLMMIADKVTS